MSRFPFPTTPDGWYGVAFASRLATGAVRAIHYFERELALFRDEAGRARVFDAHCPHMGAHLGHGGTVRGDGIRCPFHGWCFDGEGHCVEVPHLGRGAMQARVRSYPVEERNGIVFAWYHAKGAAPDWEVPEYREGGAAAWTEWTTSSYTVRTHVQEMAENILDLPHFWNVHDMEELGDKKFEARFEGPRMIVEQTLRVAASGSAAVEVLARTTNSGPGISATQVRFGEIETLTLITHTPVDDESVELQLNFCMQKLDDQAAAAAIEKRNRDIVIEQFRQDIPIWENKVYRERPPLTAADGPIPAYREWYRRFYSDWQG